MFGADLTMNMIEFFGDPSNAERSQISQSSPPGSGESSKTVYVFRPVLWNIFPRWIFLIMDEVMLSRSMSTPNCSLARLRISDMWRGPLASFNMLYAILTCDGPFSRGSCSTSSPASLRKARMALSWYLSITSWNLAHSLTSMMRSFPCRLVITSYSVCQQFIYIARYCRCDTLTG